MGNTPTTPSLTLAVRTRKRPHRLTLRKRGVRARVTVSAPTTVQLTLRGGGAKIAVTRKLTNAGTTTIRLRLREVVAVKVKRLTLRVSAAGAAPVTTRIRPRP